MKKFNKEQLDLMTSEEVAKYRRKYITASKWNDSDKKYVLELELYQDIRFKSEKFEMFDRWIEKDKDYKKRGIKDEVSSLACSLLNKEDGHNIMYYLGVVGNLKKIGTFEYIIGIDTHVPDNYNFTWVK